MKQKPISLREASRRAAALIGPDKAISAPAVAEPSSSAPAVAEPSSSAPAVAEPSPSAPAVAEPSVEDPSVPPPGMTTIVQGSDNAVVEDPPVPPPGMTEAQTQKWLQNLRITKDMRALLATPRRLRPQPNLPMFDPSVALRQQRALIAHLNGEREPSEIPYDPPKATKPSEDAPERRKGRPPGGISQQARENGVSARTFRRWLAADAAGVPRKSRITKEITRLRAEVSALHVTVAGLRAEAATLREQLRKARGF